MRRRLLILLPAAVLATAAAALWWTYARPRDPLAEALALADQGDLRAAQLALLSLERRHPTDGEVHFRLGEVQLRRGDAAAAEAELRLARDLGIGVVRIARPLADALIRLGRPEDLLAGLSATGLPPVQAAAVQVQRTAALLALGDLAAAETAAAGAEWLQPGSVDVRLNASRVARARGDFAAAEKKADLALALQPCSAEALLTKGQLLAHRGAHALALMAFDIAIEQDPKQLAARLERANALLEGDAAAAAPDIATALQLAPDSALALYMQGVMLARTEDFTGADLALVRLGPMLGRFPRGFYYLSLAKYHLGQGEQAAEAAARHLVRHPGDAAAMVLAARIELAARRPARAIALAGQAVELAGPDAAAFDLLGQAAALDGRLSEAVAAFARASLLAPDDTDIRVHLGSARLGLAALGRAAEADVVATPVAAMLAGLRAGAGRLRLALPSPPAVPRIGGRPHRAASHPPVSHPPVPRPRARAAAVPQAAPAANPFAAACHVPPIPGDLEIDPALLAALPGHLQPGQGYGGAIMEAALLHPAP